MVKGDIFLTEFFLENIEKFFQFEIEEVLNLLKIK